MLGHELPQGREILFPAIAPAKDIEGKEAWRFARGRRFALCWDCPGFAVALGSPSLACLASCNTAPAYRPPRRRGWPALVKGATAPRSPAGGHWR